ncbi:coiled-coil domain-containing protein 186 [Calliphora vicina]|uniref:coiled-coil domain-containing protein 186 n=1 Tax=Calliphora vicina TaxID=7373 RepID=UPI00325ACF74
MENEELTKNITTCDENPDKQHSIVIGQTKQLTSADIEATVQLEREQEQATGKETINIATTTIESGNDNRTTVEVVKPLLVDKNATQISANTEEVQKSITSTVNAVSAVNGMEVEEEGNKMVTKTKNSQENVANNDDVGEGSNGVVLSQTKPTSVSTSSSLNNSPSVRYSDLAEKHHEVVVEVKKDKIQQHGDCELKLQQQMLQYEQQMEQLKAALQQKDNMITLFQRENAILEKEKEAFRKEKDLANKEKESTVIKFAMKEKSVIDAKKEKEVVEKQLTEARKEIKNYTTKFQALNEEKSRVTYLMDEKCNEVRKYQRECEKLKTDYGHLESKLKYHMNKLNMETEAKLALEKKLEEERNAPNKMEEKANEKIKIEFEAQSILLKHDISNKIEQLDKLFKESEVQKDVIKQLQEQLNKETQEKSHLLTSFNSLQEEHNHIQNSYSEEMLNSAKLRGQLEELQVLKTQNTLNEDKIFTLTQELNEAIQKLQDNEHDLEQLHAKEKELLSFNKEMSESIVELQNQICLLKSKAQGTAAENDLLKKERLAYDEKYATLENQLKQEQNQKNEERLLLAKHLSEKTKLYENTKIKLENVLGDFEATKHKHATIVKELQREIAKFKRAAEQNADNHRSFICSRCQNPSQNNGYHHKENEDKVTAIETLDIKRSHSRQSSISTTGGQSAAGSRRGSESSESDTVTGREMDFKDDNKGPSKKHLVERILRLQQASARQTEKIDFLEQHTLSLVAELQKKSKVVQYYMLRDQAGALTSSKSDQNKSELAKYGHGVMSAIYGGIKGVENKSMSLELSLEINKKLQAVLEDTLLKNITLKENLDVLGLEVDNLTRKLRQIEARQ